MLSLNYIYYSAFQVIILPLAISIVNGFFRSKKTASIKIKNLIAQSFLIRNKVSITITSLSKFVALCLLHLIHLPKLLTTLLEIKVGVIRFHIKFHNHSLYGYFHALKFHPYNLHC